MGINSITGKCSIISTIGNDDEYDLAIFQGLKMWNSSDIKKRPSQLRPNSVLVKITNEEKRKIFETDVENTEGQIISLITSLRAEQVADEFYSQAVYVGNVVAVASDVTHIEVGDTVIVDYMADTYEQRVAYMEDDGKVVILDADTKYHIDDKIAFASMRARADTYTWRKGDVDSQSWIYAIVRDGRLMPNNDYILLAHQDLTFEGESSSGIRYYDTEGDVVVRKVIAAPDQSAVKKGDIIVVEAFALLERSFGNVNFDIIMELDLLGTINVE